MSVTDLRDAKALREMGMPSLRPLWTAANCPRPPLRQWKMASRGNSVS